MTESEPEVKYMSILKFGDTGPLNRVYILEVGWSEGKNQVYIYIYIIISHTQVRTFENLSRVYILEID